MSKNHSTKKLNKNTSHVRAVVRNLITSLINYEVIRTTEAKAKVMKPYLERLITVAKRNDAKAMRYAESIVPEKIAIKKLFEVLVPRYATRIGGFVSMTIIGIRQGDSSVLYEVSLVDGKKVPYIKRKIDKKPKAKKATATKTSKTEKVEAKSKKKVKAIKPKEGEDSKVEEVKETKTETQSKKQDETFTDRLSKFLGLKRKQTGPTKE